MFEVRQYKHKAINKMNPGTETEKMQKALEKIITNTQSHW